jgi:hypothetical protein
MIHGYVTDLQKDISHRLEIQDDEAVLNLTVEEEE